MVDLSKPYSSTIFYVGRKTGISRIDLDPYGETNYLRSARLLGVKMEHTKCCDFSSHRQARTAKRSRKHRGFSKVTSILVSNGAQCGRVGALQSGMCVYSMCVIKENTKPFKMAGVFPATEE